jgi:hypothetical protein
MRSALIGAVAGWLIGGMLAGALYCVGHGLIEGSSGFTFYSPYTSSTASTGPSTRQLVGYVLVGVVFGGGPGAAAGAVVGGVKAVLVGIREHRAGGSSGAD